MRERIAVKENRIEEFIRKFKFKYSDELEEVFTSGNCYYFALILKEKFSGEIYYLPIDNHFICRVMSSYYDITGRIEPTEHPVKWSDFKSDKTWRRRIIRDCIDFDTRK